VQPIKELLSAAGRCGVRALKFEYIRQLANYLLYSKFYVLLSVLPPLRFSTRSGIFRFLGIFWKIGGYVTLLAM